MYYQFDPTLGLALIVSGCATLLAALAAAVWVMLRGRKLTHAERMKALDLGVLPEVLQAAAEQSRTRALAAVGVLVPLAMAGAAAGGTAIILSYHLYENASTVLYVVWGVCGLTALATATSAVGSLQRRGKSAPAGDKAAARRAVDTREAIKESPPELKEKFT